jgi:hypothetical protein
MYPPTHRSVARVSISLPPQPGLYTLLLGSFKRDWIEGSDGGKCLWSGDDGFSVERWNFWKQRFGIIGGLRRRGFAGRVIDDIVRCSRQAVMTMDAVEREDGFALDGMSILFGHDDTSCP